MEKKLFWMAICTTLVMTFCSNPKNEVSTEAPQLFTKTVIPQNASVQQFTNGTLNKVSAYYFEVGLFQNENKPGTFFAKNQASFYEVVQQDGSQATFKGLEEFMAFMSERGYEKADQLKLKYHTEYTFRKKK